MFAFERAVEALGVQNEIHLGGARPTAGIPGTGPEGGKGFCIFSAAFEARPVTGGKRRDFVEEEKLGVVFPPHVAMTPVEFQAAADPGAADVPAVAQRPVVAMKSSAAVSQHGSPRLDRNQLTEGIDTIL
jgi:hypothetical protein